MNDKRKPNPVSESELSLPQVADFLATHPDFFNQNPDILENLELPHQSGEAISLIERQVGILRDRNEEIQGRLDNLLESARVNDKLFEKTKRLVLSMLEASNLDGMVSVLYESLATDFEIEFYRLILLADNDKIQSNYARIVGLTEANYAIGTLLRSNRAICGVLGGDELAFLFGDDGKKIGSVAATPLNNGRIFGVLAIGNSDPNYYRSSMGTLFLGYIAEVITRITPRLLP
jgi:uncharacterized protein